MTVLQIILVTYLVLHFTGNLPRSEPRLNRRQRRAQNDQIAYSLYVAKQQWAEEHPSREPQLPPAKSMRFITIVLCLPLIIMIAGKTVQLLTR